MGNLTSRHLYVREDGIAMEEQEPMLGQDRLPSVHSRIEMDDSLPPKPSSSFIESIRQRFTFVYITLGLVLLVALAVLVVTIMLLCNMKNMDQRYRNITGTGSERFMRLYEDFSAAKGTHRNPATLNDIINRLPPEQLAQARLFGLIPKEQPTANQNLGDPIKPVSVSGTKDGKQQDIPLLSASLDELPEQIKAKATDFYTHSWFDSSCSIQCNKADITIPPLVVISLDGFANEYLDRKLVPSLDKLSECGARAKYMYPSYPSKTFPNHYTIATGLYPETHGIVDNYVYDPKVSSKIEDVRKSKKSGYFEGEPIWSTVVKQSRKMFCLMWPGCSFNITGFNPTVDIPYNKDLPYSSRVEMLIDWLKLPAEKRPSLIMAYFDQPDTVGHFHKTDAEVNLELSYIESVLNYLLTTLKKNELLDCINVVILSDHGMQTINERVYLDSLKLNTKDILITNGVVSRIYLANSTTQTTESIINNLKCHESDKFTVYDRKQVPVRYHYSSPRVGDIVLEGKPGTIIFKNKKEDYRVLSDHGYDYLDSEMRAIFFARGPNIRPKTVAEPFQNIELFNLFSDLLRINNDVSNNGTEGSLSEILYNINSFKFEAPDTTLRPVQECDPIAPLQHRHLKACSDSKQCQADAQTANVKLDGCPVQTFPSGLLYTDQPNYCFINLCSVLSSVSLTTSFGVPTIAFETLTSQDFVDSKPLPQVCAFNDLRFEPSCDNWTATVEEKHENSLQWNSILTNYENELMHYNRLQFLLYDEFVKGPFAYLQNLTIQYARKYSRILSFTGAVYDFDMNGLADSQDVFWHHISSPDHKNEEKVPSHIVRVIIKCEDGAWHINGASCKRSSETRVLAFILPNANSDLNCLSPNEYLLKNSARVRDVELLSNVQFFREQMFYPERDANHWRLNITEQLWPI
ncbi:Ectonucleotide pyrophosphatase/phosphodiesterase C27A7.1 [Aphelenchoides bicaudatus]|nr:Ectonucleotide pyrophosphatase/phosphodiesterase C27A7.1 [Aphelenchoides bicaudatus]